MHINVNINKLADQNINTHININTHTHTIAGCVFGSLAAVMPSAIIPKYLILIPLCMCTYVKLETCVYVCIRVRMREDDFNKENTIRSLVTHCLHDKINTHTRGQIKTHKLIHAHTLSGECHWWRQHQLECWWMMSSPWWMMQSPCCADKSTPPQPAWCQPRSPPNHTHSNINMRRYRVNDDGK